MVLFTLESVLNIGSLPSKSVGIFTEVQVSYDHRSYEVVTEVVETREYRMKIDVDDVEKTSSVKSPTTQSS